MKKRFISTLAAFAYGSLTLCMAIEYPANVKKALMDAGENAEELQKVLTHYEDKNLQMYQAACFLIGNMGIHCGQSYNWQNSSGQRIPFDEFEFPTYEKAVEKFNLLSRTQKLNPVKTFSWDLQNITADYLIRNIDDAFSLWKSKWASKLSFESFCEYLLPYRIMDEPLCDWRQEYRKAFATQWSKCEHGTVRQVCTSLCEDLKLWFADVYEHEIQKEPQHVLSAKQILFRRQGYCEDMANWGVYILRSKGIASCVDFTPFWATSTDGHFWQCAFDETGRTIPFFMGDDTPAEFIMHREPSKVFRITYSTQNETPANYLSEEEIPEGVLRSSNLIDVTGEYWKVGNIHLNLPARYNAYRASFLCVLNGGKWQPVWWSRNRNGHVDFQQMTCGVVYLPICHERGKNIPAAPPQLLRKDGTVQELEPDMLHTRQVRIEEQKNYLKFRSGKKYSLFYWDTKQRKWTLVKTKIPTLGNQGSFEALTFDNVPSNALLRLMPEYTQQKERPFTIDDNGKREWW